MKSISLDTSWIHNTGKMREELKLLHEESASLAPVGVSPFWAHWKVLDQKKTRFMDQINRAPRSSTSLVDAAHIRKCFKRWEQIWGALLRMNSSTKNLINSYLASHKVGKPHNSVSGYCKKKFWLSCFFQRKLSSVPSNMAAYISRGKGMTVNSPASQRHIMSGGENKECNVSGLLMISEVWRHILDWFLWCNLDVKRLRFDKVVRGKP